MIGDTFAVRRGLMLGSVVGLLNAGVAILLAWVFGRRPGEFGWYSYTPMPRRYADYAPLPTTPGWKIGLVLVAVFLFLNMAIAAVVLVVSRRRRIA